MTPEGKVLSAVTSYLRIEMKNGRCYYERRNAVGLNYRKGIPDIWFTKNGKHYEVELKRPGGTRSTLQYKYEKIFKELNTEYVCIDSFEKFLEFYHKDDKSPDE